MVSGYDPQRGEQVIAWVRRFLDESLPLENGSYQDVVAFKVVDKQLRIQLKNGKETTLRIPAQFVGYRGDAAALTCILLKNNGLHIELQIDANGRIGKDDPAHINDVIVEVPSVPFSTAKIRSRRLMRKIKSCCTAICWA